MSLQLSDLEPAALWRGFFSICAIPHPSHHEEELARWLVDWAAERSVSCERDAAGNVVMRKAAAEGCGGRPGIILQAHMDMVPQAAAGSAHDFTRDPIRPRFDPADPEWLVADGTTLGADDGMGMAAALAMLEDDTVRRGPLECLFTVNEEDGMSGAAGLQPGLLKGRYLINLDGEDAEELTIGCAGMLRTRSEASFEAAPAPGGQRWAKLTVSGLLGGHSGMDIHRGRGNAIMLALRLLGAEAPEPGLRLASFEGGGAANAIPREARALVGLPAGAYDAWSAGLAARGGTVRNELGANDPGFSFGLAEAPAPAACLSAEDTAAAVSALYRLPDGCMKMEPSMPDITRTSSNLGSLSLAADGGRMAMRTLALVRSSLEQDKQRVCGELEDALAALGARSTRPSESPAWKPEPTSLLLSLAVDEYRNAFCAAPKILSTHAGLECGVFRPIYPDWDMLAIGPTIRYPHSPDERVHVPSVQKFWRFLTALVSRLR